MTEEKSPFELDDELEYPEPWKRGVAFAIDKMVIGASIKLIGWGLPFVILKESPEYQLVYFLLIFTLTWLYFAYLESAPTQGTLGKFGVGLQVSDEQGERISFERASGRFFAKILSVLTLLIGFMMIYWDKKHQALHDKIAKTLVIKSKQIADL